MASLAATTSMAFEAAKVEAKDRLRGGSAGADRLEAEALEKLRKLGAETRHVLGNLDVLVRMVRAYADGSYSDVPEKTIIAAAAAVIYFVNPFDLIPDPIPGGVVDDAAVIALVLAAIESDIEDFEAWEKRRPKRIRPAKRKTAKPTGAKRTAAKATRANRTAKKQTTTTQRPTTKATRTSRPLAKGQGSAARRGATKATRSRAKRASSKPPKAAA
jgi:uncharacterized membrane protein YkvA (DUF1232 family)